MLGNQTHNSSFVDLAMSIKYNVFRTMNTSDVFVVLEINDGEYLCQSITNTNLKITCIACKDIEIKAQDVVLVIFTKNNFKIALDNYKANNVILRDNTVSNAMHNLNYGVIIGVIYSMNTEEAQ